MKIFFITPYSEKKDYQGEIDKVIEIIESTGAEVISAEKTRQYQDIFSEENVKKFGSRENVHYEFIRQGVLRADAVIVEVNPGDFRVGHETTLSLLYKKPVLCLSKTVDYSRYIIHENFKAVLYTDISLKEVVISFLQSVSKSILAKRNSNFNISTRRWGYDKTDNKKNIAVLGSINVDMVTKVPTIPKENEVLISEGLKLVPGGKATNASIAMARLGENSYMLGRVGNDYFGEDVRNVFKREMVNIDFVDTDSFIPTGTIMINVDAKGVNTIVVNEDANIRISKKTIDDFLAKVDRKEIKVDCFYTTLETLTEIIVYAVSEFKKRNILVFCDAGPQARPLPESIYSQIDFLSPNEYEATAMTGIKVVDVESANSAAEFLRSKGANNVIICLGEKGAVLLSKEIKEPIYYPGNKVRVVDVTAAGDAFRGGFVVEYLEHHDLNKAMIFGNRAGAYAVTKLGAYDSMPTREELAFLDIIP